MSRAVPGVARSRVVRLCAWCAVAVLAEIALYASYDGHDARFHWFTHFFAGASVALLVMAAITAATRRAVRLPLVWLLLGHLAAMFPDLLFVAGHAHERWMDVFMGHISTHFVVGRDLTWYLLFLGCLALYLAVADRLRPEMGR
jgi:hypothetical protein